MHRVVPVLATLEAAFCESIAMREYTLVDCETGLIYGPYETCAMARDHAEREAIATWEIIAGDEKLVDWSAPQQSKEASAQNRTELAPTLAEPSAGVARAEHVDAWQPRSPSML